jgi:hypothetical protein
MFVGTIIACNTNSSDPDRDKNDSLNMNPQDNTDTRSDQVPIDRTDSNSYGKDTASYERMPGKTNDSMPQ